MKQTALHKSQKTELLGYLRKMTEIRYFEEQVLESYAKGQIAGMCHVCIGEEAVGVGVCAAINKDDYITSTHRGHGHLLAKGGDSKRMMAELFGRVTGYCKGRGGSMHIADVSLGHLGANGIVGAGVPIGCGAALSIKYKKAGQVVVCFFGDAAANQGVVHESLNMAALWKLPVVFVCENNLYAVSTHVSKSCPTKHIADKADGYGIPKFIVDGMDVAAVKEAADKAIQHARQGKGPSFIECKTYCFQGHGTSNDRPYRTKEEEQQWLQKCPIKALAAKLLKDNVMSDSEYSELQKEAKALIENAVEFAEKSPYPLPETAGENVFAE